jgi:NadR type nicotinamide-nucleotide adenylyltransferase
MAIKKIVFSGPESTGKTTLSRDLSLRLKAPWVSEYARFYLQHLPFKGKETLEDILKGQLGWEDFFMAQAKQFLICDTDPLVLAVWAKDKLGSLPPSIQEALQTRSYDLRFLCYPDTEWVPDPLRQDAHRREEIFEIYGSLVEQYGLDYKILKGNFDKKKEIVDLEIKKLYF